MDITRIILLIIVSQLDKFNVLSNILVTKFYYLDSDDDDDPPKNSKKEKYFWQYNIQSKGPKGQRLVMKCKMEDPHVLNEVTDPVFSPDCSVRGIKHSGKLANIRHSGKFV